MSSNVIEEKPAGTADSADKVFDILNTDDNADLLQDDKVKKPEDKEVKDDKEDEKKDKKDEKEEELEIEEPDEEEEYEVTDDYQEMPSRQQILKDFPELFKKYPAVQDAMYRNRDYSEIFPTIQEAREASTRVKELEEIEQTVMGGSIEPILKGVRENDEQAFLGIVDSFLPALAKTDPTSYYLVLDRIVGTTLYSAAAEGKKIGGEAGEQLFLAAQYLQHYISGTYDIKLPPQTILPQKDNRREQEILAKEQEFQARQASAAINDVSDRTMNLIRSTVEKNIDPRDQMSGYIRTTAVKDVMNNVQEAIKSDTRFTRYLDSLWIEASRDNYSRKSVDKIRGAILTKAKNILPNELRKVRADALKGSSRRVKDDVEDTEEDGEIREVRRTSTPTTARKNSPLLHKDGRRKSTLDVLNED